MSWAPGRYKRQLELEVPYENVPNHLKRPLWTWCAKQLASVDFLRATLIHLRISAPDAGVDHYGALGALLSAANADPTIMLDVIEFLLGLELDYYWKGAQELDVLLRLANSAYRVNGQQNGLESVVSPEATAQVRTVIASTSASTSSHLTEAWNCAYGRKADPVKAYSEAIKGVESSAIPVLRPNDSRATLGSIVGDLRSNPTGYTFILASRSGDSIASVLNMASTLWDGQTSRHGGNSATRSETVDEARVAVHLAVTLAQLFSSGAVTKL